MLTLILLVLVCVPFAAGLVIGRVVNFKIAFWAWIASFPLGAFCVLSLHTPLWLVGLSIVSLCLTLGAVNGSMH